MEEKKLVSKRKNDGISRRKFLGGSALAAAGFTIVPRHVLGGTGFTPPSDIVNIAAIGAGGKGRSDIVSVSKGANIVALCDVDDKKMAETLAKVKKGEGPEALAKQLEKAPKYKDFRIMLEKEKSIDAVTVSTPDHTHAVAAAMAMKMGKHCFVQKPLTHSVEEARALRKIAKEANVTTQMGNQGHAGEGGRLVCEWIWDGAIGEVHEVHTWTNRPVWPQGVEVDRPQDTPPAP